MRLVYPTDEADGTISKRGAHFGKAKYYTIVTLTENTISDVEVIANPGHASGGCSNAVANIMELNPDALIVSGIGGSPAQKFAEVGLSLYYDKESPTVQESIRAYIEAKLPQINTGTCSAH